jgi:hypothetical protein
VVLDLDGAADIGIGYARHGQNGMNFWPVTVASLPGYFIWHNS